MKEKNEELERNSTVSNIFQLKQENEDVQYQRQFTIRNEDVNITGSRNTGILIDQDDDREGIKLSLNIKNLIDRLQNISADNEGRHSGEWKDLHEAASQVMTFIVQKRPVGSDTGIALLLQLSEACHHYNETHIDKSGKKIDERKKNVRAIRKLICDCFADEVREKLQQDDLPEEPEDIRKEEAEANVKRFSEYYVAFSSKIGKDMIGSAEEKLCRRWNALRSCEEDIRIYRLANNDDKKIDKQVLYVLNEYKTIRSQIMFLDKLKEEGGHEKLFENTLSKELLEKTYRTEGREIPQAALISKAKGNEGLSDKQLSGLSKIDTWIMRNFNNGGYMAYFGGTTNRADIVNSLFSLSRRERMYIYYLIEKNERINPGLEGFGVSQTSYEPDVSVFKDRMIANKLKFYSRFSGGYIYWNKLSQAMAIAMRTRPLLQTATENADLLSENSKAKIDDLYLTDIQKEQKQHLCMLYKYLKNSKAILEELNKKKKEKDKKKGTGIKKDPKKELEELRRMAAQELAELQELDDRIEKKNLNEIRESVEGAGVKKASKKADVKQYLSGMPGDIGGLAIKSTKLVKEQVLGFSEKTGKSILNVMNPANATLGAINGAIGFVFGAIALVDGAGGMSWVELAETGAGLATSAAATISKGAGFVKLFTGKDNVLTETGYANALIVADLGIQAMHTISMTRDEYHRMKAAEKMKKVLKAKKKANESAEFERNMIRLQDRISDSRAKSTFSKLALTGALVTTMVVSPPVGAVIAAVQFMGGIVNRVFENRRKRANKYYLFDNHFKIDEQADKLIKDKKVKAGADKETLKSQLRRRVAASIGFASPSDAADAFAKRYAQKMIRLANAGGANSDYYIQLIKGFGLYYRYVGANSKKNRPSVADLAKKLTS